MTSLEIDIQPNDFADQRCIIKSAVGKEEIPK